MSKKSLLAVLAVTLVLLIAVSCEKKGAKSISLNHVVLEYTLYQEKDSVLVVTGVGNPQGNPVWSVDDSNIVSITPSEPNKCTVHPLDEGSANVTVTWDGCQARCIVSVKKPKN